jgi:hypothetical protein
MNTIVVIGMTGEGKSEFIKDYIQGRKCLVNDVQNEYGARTKYPNQKPILLSDNVRDPRSRYTGGSFKEFMKLVESKRNTICVFEEATMFLQGAISKDMYKILINKMHTGNVYIMPFHSIRKVPPGILDITNFVVLYRTADERLLVEKKYPALLSTFDEIKANWEAMKGKYKTVKLIT